VNPKNLMFAAAAGAGLAALGLPSANAVGSLIVFVVIASVVCHRSPRLRPELAHRWLLARLAGCPIQS
jgi:hypothetical protein